MVNNNALIKPFLHCFYSILHRISCKIVLKGRQNAFSQEKLNKNLTPLKPKESLQHLHISRYIYSFHFLRFQFHPSVHLLLSTMKKLEPDPKANFYGQFQETNFKFFSFISQILHHTGLNLNLFIHLFQFLAQC